ncbi:MAG: Resolvase protein [Firmicutes bacterium]|nr:Resolvase protein [Bacillota bacterium]
MHAIYIRVSTEDQARHGYSIDFQREECRLRLAELGITEDIEEFVDDGYSGEFLERPALSRLRNALYSGTVGTVTIYDPDRMSRNLTNQLILSDDMEKNGVRLMFVTGDYDISPEGRLFFSLKGAVAAYEKAKIRERTSRGRRQKALQGKIVQNARPYGYSWDEKNSKYIVNVDQANVVHMIYDMLLHKEMGCRGIALELKRLGIHGPKGSPLSATTIHKVLSREMYCGTHYLFRQRVKKISPKQTQITNLPPEEWVPVQVPAIVTRKEWEQAQLQLKRNRKFSRRNTQQDYLLRGFCRCLACGRSLTPHTRRYERKKAQAKHYSYYTCITLESNQYAIRGDHCRSMRIPVEKLDNQVWNDLVAIAIQEPSFTLSIAKIPSNHSAKLSALSQELTALKNRHSEIARLLREGILESAAAETELRTANRQIVTLNNQLLSVEAAKKKLLATKPEDMTVDQILSAATFDDKRRILKHAEVQLYILRRESKIKYYFSHTGKI